MSNANAKACKVNSANYQSRKFKDAARQLGTDDDETRFEKRPKKLVR